MSTLPISQLAHRSGVPASTVRYYENMGVLRAAWRTDSGYCRYDDDAGVVTVAAGAACVVRHLRRRPAADRLT